MPGTAHGEKERRQGGRKVEGVNEIKTWICKVGEEMKLYGQREVSGMR